MMRAIMGLSRKKAGLIAGLFLVSLVFFYLRAGTIGHLLMWDEARNIISLRAFLVNNTYDPFYAFYFFHPPLYMAFAALAFPFHAGLDIRLEFLSLFISYLTLVTVYLLSAGIAGRIYAFFTGFFLSLMPVSIAHDTWVKRDGLAALLGYLGIFLLLKKRPFWSAAAFSFSLLAKENALFFIPAAVIILLALRQKSPLKKIIVICAAALIFNAWWYVCFSRMPGNMFDIFFSKAKNAYSWANSPLYYAGKLLPDLGLPILVFFLIGLGYILYLFFRKNKRSRLVPLIIFLCVYIPISSIIMCKTPWLCVSAAPALAMIAAAGAMFLLRGAGRPVWPKIILIFLLISATVNGAVFSYDGYHIAAYGNGWYGAKNSRDLAVYLNTHMRDGEKLLITQFLYWGLPVCAMCPVFLYYYRGNPVYVIDGKDSAQEVMREIVKNKISWLAVSDSAKARPDFRSLIRDLTDSALGKPARAGCSYIWNTDALWRGH